MKLALCTTTINVPHVLKLYRACSIEARFFVAIDKKTPDAFRSFVAGLGNAQHYWHGDGGWKCSAPIGWDTLARRNIAFLEALKWGADAIVSIDDDNAPLDIQYFVQYSRVLQNRFDGLCARSGTGWFDPGKLLVPWAKHRGIPHGHHTHVYQPITGAKIGVATGLVLGDSDVDATTRLERQVETHSVSELARAGVVVRPDTHTVFNSQNTAVIRELVPAWFMMPGVGRMDDIYASLLVQRVARERDFHVHVGQPFVYQQRNEHDLVKDLRAEVDGYDNVTTLARILDHIILPGKTVIDDTRTIYQALRHTATWLPEQAIDAALAWLEDCEEAAK